MQPALGLVYTSDFGTGRDARSPHGSITDAASALGVNPRTLSDALHGRRVPVAELKKTQSG